MTDTPTPPMTPEQRADLVNHTFYAGAVYAAEQLEADGVTIATLTADRDAAQYRAYHLAVAIMGGEDAPGLADSLPIETLEAMARAHSRLHLEDIDRLAAAQAEIARLTAALATAREDGIGPDELGFNGLVFAAKIEAIKAMKKFPQPNYVISKFAEESGEVVKAAIHCAEGRETKENVLGEMKQAIAMLYRLYVEGDEVHGLKPLGEQPIQKGATT